MIWPVRRFSITTSSMMPCFRKGDVVLAFSMKVVSPPKRGDIVFFKKKGSPLVNREIKNKKDFRVKRVIGMPGENLWISHGKVNIGNRGFTDFVHDPEDISDHKLTWIPANHYFLMGDNRSNSIDSRDPKIGLVHIENILYKARIIFWPPLHGKILKFW